MYSTNIIMEALETLSLIVDMGNKFWELATTPMAQIDFSYLLEGSAFGSFVGTLLDLIATVPLINDLSMINLLLGGGIVVIITVWLVRFALEILPII